MIDNWDIQQVSAYSREIFKILDSAMVKLSDMSPSEWAESNRMLTADVTSMPGMFSYQNSPYTKPIVDCLDPKHPARVIALMAGSQIGKSTSVVENGIGYIISQHPGNILYLVGHEKLIKDSVKKVDTMIDNSGLRNLIKSSSLRVRNAKSGDTDDMKEFPGGYIKFGIANHGYLRNISMQYGFIDDFERMKSSDKSSGSTEEMIEQRFAAYYKKMKLMYISTPELEESSNIKAVYLKGDQRKWHIPCPCCSELIVIEWSVKSEVKHGTMAGITWETDSAGVLLPESVGYTCQKCDGFFDDSNKMDFVRAGKYIPTAEPSEPGYYSFHLSSLISPTYMYGWVYYVRKYIIARPSDGSINVEKWKTFKNLVLGETFSPIGSSISMEQLQQNIRSYEIGILPEKQSIEDGNGRIVMLTLGSDLNGTEDDARLDWEIIAYSETGATYSIDQGSIGTFINRDKHPEKREHFTYRKNANNSVWPILEAIISKKYVKDSDGRSMKIFVAGIDAGYMTNYVYDFVDASNDNVVALKGDDDANGAIILTGTKMNADMKTYRPARERPNLFLVASNHTKDILADNMALKWDGDLHKTQPSGFMNFPQPSDGKYLFNSYFKHYAAEHKIVDKRGNYRWVKRSKNHQNHFFDVRCYALVVKDIFLDKLFSDYGIKNGTWADYVNAVTKNSKA